MLRVIGYILIGTIVFSANNVESISPNMAAYSGSAAAEMLRSDSALTAHFANFLSMPQETLLTAVNENRVHILHENPNCTFVQCFKIYMYEIDPISHVTKDGGYMNDTSFRSMPVPTTRRLSITDVFSLHSRPGAKKTIYLDMDGHVTTNTLWNTALKRDSIIASAITWDSVPGANSNTEIVNMYAIWYYVAEKYSTFEVDVTTEEPPPEKMFCTNNRDLNAYCGIRVVISHDVSWSRNGGWAYIGMFGDLYGNVAFVFADELGMIPAWIADSAAHEAGHTILLQHDGQIGGSSNGYYIGHGEFGSSWAPIMGESYYYSIQHWSKGEYYNANQKQDDLATMGLFLPIEVDDFPNQVSEVTSTVQPLQANQQFNGKIHVVPPGTPYDKDCFTFSVSSLQQYVKFQQDSFERSSAVVKLSLYQADGVLLQSSTTVYSTDIQTYPHRRTTLEYHFQNPGVYGLCVSPQSYGSPLSNPPTGWTAYGCIGPYYVKTVSLSSVTEFSTTTPPPAEYIQKVVFKTELQTSQRPAFLATLAQFYQIDVSRLSIAEEQRRRMLAANTVIVLIKWDTSEAKAAATTKLQSEQGQLNVLLYQNSLPIVQVVEDPPEVTNSVPEQKSVSDSSSSDFATSPGGVVLWVLLGLALIISIFFVWRWFKTRKHATSTNVDTTPFVYSDTDALSHSSYYNATYNPTSYQHHDNNNNTHVTFDDLENHRHHKKHKKHKTHKRNFLKVPPTWK